MTRKKKMPPCSICGWPIEPDLNGWTGGHNAQPVNDGRCCGDCNATVVIPTRLRWFTARKEEDVA